MEEQQAAEEEAAPSDAEEQEEAPEDADAGEADGSQEPEAYPGEDGDEAPEEQGDPEEPLPAEDAAEAPGTPERGYVYEDDGRDGSGPDPEKAPRRRGADRPEGGQEPAVKGSKKVRYRARRRVKSLLFLLPVLCYSVHAVAAVVNVLLGGAEENIYTVVHTVDKYFGSYGIVSAIVTEVRNFIDMIAMLPEMYVKGAMLAVCFPGILLMLGLWMAFMLTHRRGRDVATSGYTLSRVAIVIKMIGVCAVLLAAIILVVSFVVAAGASSRMMMMIIGVVVLLLLVLYTVFAILYYVQVLFSIRAIRAAVRNGSDLGPLPGFMVFVNILGCAFTALCMLPMAPDDYIGLIVKGAYAAWLLLISLWTIVYKASIRRALTKA